MTGVTLVDAADTFRDGDEVRFVSSRRHYKFASSRRHYKFTEKIQDSYKIHGNIQDSVFGDVVVLEDTEW